MPRVSPVYKPQCCLSFTHSRKSAAIFNFHFLLFALYRAEGRLIQACEQAGAPHALAQGFGSREAWEVAASDGNVFNAHYCFKELGARVHQVTALRTQDLANWEGEINLRVSDAMAKLESHTSAAAATEQRAADLIKAAQRAASDNQRELENLRIRFESANRMALHWQEQAALTGESLKELDTKLTTAENRQSDGTSPTRRPHSASSDDETIAELRAQISALQMEHAGQIRDLESRHAAMYSQLQAAAANESYTADAVEAVRIEAAAALEEMELTHAAEIERLLEERARLDSALRCIKDMMNPCVGKNNSNNNAGASAVASAAGGDGGSSADKALHHEGLDNEDMGAVSDQDTLDGCAADVYVDAPAVGIPVEQPLATPIGVGGGSGVQDPLVASYSAFNARYTRPASAASNGSRSLYHYLDGNASTIGGAVTAPPATVSPAPADFAVFDRAGNRAKVNHMYEMVNALRPGSGDSSTIGGVVAQYNREDNHETYHFAVEEQLHLGGTSSDNEIFASPSSNNMSGSLPTSPESRNRVLMAGGGCAMVDFKGERPDAVTEASMSRILDAPSSARVTIAHGNGTVSASIKPAAVSVGAEDEISYQVRRPSENSTNAQIAVKEEGQQTTAKAPRHLVPCTSAPASTVKSEKADIIIDGTSPWAAGSLSLPGSSTSTPLKSISDRNSLQPSVGAAEKGNDDNNGTENENNENAGYRTWAPTADVLALDESSPSTANFLTQYMADQVSVRASLPIKYNNTRGNGGYAGYGRSSNGMQSRPKSGGHQPVSTNPGKIPAIRHSAPGVLKKSTFLQRPLVTENDLFGGR